MKKKNLGTLVKKTAVFSLAATLLMSSLTGCGNSGSSSDSKGKVIVGITNTFEKTAFINDDGELDGFEVELLKAIDEKLEDYEFEFQQSTFDNILISLDSNKIDLGSCMYEYSEERAKKYLYGEEGYRDYSVYIETLKGSGYTTLESLAGKTIGDISSTDNPAIQIQLYNEENPDKEVKLDYFGDIAWSVVLDTLEEGRWEAVLTTYSGFQGDIAERGDIFELGEAITESEAYFLFPSDGTHEDLQKAVDQALKDLKADGTLDELSNKWYGTNAYPED